DLLFDEGVYIELVSERTPYPLECGVVDRCLLLQIVELGESFTEPVMVSEDQLGDVSHSDSQPPLIARPLRPSCPMLAEPSMREMVALSHAPKTGTEPSMPRWRVPYVPRPRSGLGPSRYSAVQLAELVGINAISTAPD